MIRTLLLVLGLLVGTGAFAQTEFQGLDLSDDKPPVKKPEETKSAKPPPPVKEADKKPVTKQEPAVERDITQDDRVKSVQRKLYLKRGRVEINPFVMFSINDPYYSKFGGALRLAFYPADSLAISVRGSLMQVLPSDDVRPAKADFHARIFYSIPIWSVMADFEWSPIYGKAAFGNSILHLDAYVLGGMGVVTTETSGNAEIGGLPDGPKRGPQPAADLGLGARFVVKDFLAVNVALINTTYVDQPAGTTKGGTQNILALYAGLSLFIPFKSSYREAE